MDHSTKSPPTDPAFAGPRRVAAIVGPLVDRESAVRDRWLCRAQADQAAAVLEKGVVLDVLRYDVEVPVVQTCEHDTGDVTNRFRVRAQVVRTGELDHPEGVMIDRVQVTRR